MSVHLMGRKSMLLFPGRFRLCQQSLAHDSSQYLYNMVDHNKSKHGVTRWQMLGAVILAMLAGHWCWTFFAPEPAPLVAVADYSASAQTAELFGQARSNNAAAAAQAVVAQSRALPQVELLGVFAGQEQHDGFAVLKIKNKQHSVLRGEKLPSGLILKQVFADYVVLEQNGQLHRVELSGVSEQRWRQLYTPYQSSQAVSDQKQQDQ